MKKILLTGSEGFLGKSLAKRLRKLNYELICVDKKNNQDLCDIGLVNSLPDVDIIIHFAAFNGTKWFYEAPFQVVIDNTEPTLNLLKRYADKVDLFIFAGTCESYAGMTDLDSSLIPTDETIPLMINDILNPRWSYGGSKINNEVSVIAAHNEFGMDFQILRFHNIYGPSQVDHFFPEFINRAKNGDTSLYGSENTRSFLYIDDAIDYVIELMDNEKAKNEIINIGSSKEISIKSVAQIILNKLCIDEELVCIDAPKGSVKRRLPNIKKLLSLTKKQNIISLDEGISKLLEKE